MGFKTFEEFFREARESQDYWEFGAILDFTEAMVREMDRQQITRAELARRLGTSPAYVTKILRGDANFTLETMVKIARALDTELRLALSPPTTPSRQSAPRRPAGHPTVARASEVREPKTRWPARPPAKRKTAAKK
jgi:transcriptional regulator with XRE-family HTH domain